MAFCIEKIQIILFKEHCSTHTTDFMQTYCPLSYIFHNIGGIYD